MNASPRALAALWVIGGRVRRVHALPSGVAVGFTAVNLNDAGRIGPVTTAAVVGRVAAAGDARARSGRRSPLALRPVG
jgi:hypothetical protein